jgi:hypothetical protein
VAALIYQLQQSGIEGWQCCVVPQGVFFRERQHAENFCERYGKELVPVEGLVTGWLAKNKPGE